MEQQTTPTDPSVGAPGKRSTPLVAIEDGAKLYHGVPAIQGIDFNLWPGEVHAIVGENGAGKSTLCKVISGAISLDRGRLHMHGHDVHMTDPRDAAEQGVAMVYQDTSLVPTMTVAQNIELGQESLFTRFRTLNTSAQQLLQSMSFNVDPGSYVSMLGTAKRQMVEIARALRGDARIVIFDEPTASLTPEEIMHLFDVIDGLRRRGIGVIFVSHALEEALQVASRITVLRDGEIRITEDSDRLTRNDLVRHMVGREISQTVYGRTSHRDRIDRRGRKVLSVENLTMGTSVKNMSFSAYAGEVLGIFGLIGSGRTETAKIVAGALKRDRLRGGSVEFEGVKKRYRVPRQAINDGIAYITEDRKQEGFFELLSIEENIYLARLATESGKRFLISRRAMQEETAPLIQRLKIRAINAAARLVELSGGNQQKVVIAKALSQEPTLLIFDEPTQGVDVGTIDEIHQMIRKLADEGKAVIVISSYLPEVLAISDRILVARQGRVVAEFPPEDVTQEDIMFAAVH